MRTSRFIIASTIAAAALLISAGTSASASTPAPVKAPVAASVPTQQLAQLICTPSSNYVYFGTSLVSNYHQSDCVRYTAHAYATGGVYQGKRVIQVCFKYTRGGTTLMSKCANSAFVNGKWTTGHVSGTVLDDLRSGSQYTTKWTYSYKTVAIGII